MTSAEIALLYPIQDSFVLPLKNEKVYHILAPQGEFALKRYDFPRGETEYIAAAMDYLSEREPTLIPTILRTRDGAAVGRYRGHDYLLTTWLPGRICNFRDYGDCVAAAKALARLHHTAQGFHYPPYPNRDKWGVWPSMMAQKQRELATLRNEVAARLNANRFDRRFLRFFDYYNAEIDAARDLLEHSGYEALQQRERAKGMICHHDPAHHNFLRADCTCALVDFDYALADVRAHDVASLLLKILKENGWVIGPALAALTAYDSVGELESDERAVIQAILRFPQDFWQVALARYCETLVMPSKCLTKLERWTNEHTLRERAWHYLSAALTGGAKK